MSDPDLRPAEPPISCVDECPDPQCACRLRPIAGCSLPIAVPVPVEASVPLRFVRRNISTLLNSDQPLHT